MDLHNSDNRGIVTVMAKHQYQNRVEGMGEALGRLSSKLDERRSSSSTLIFDDTKKLNSASENARNRKGLFTFSDRARAAVD